MVFDLKGPCILKFNGVDVGKTIGGVKLVDEEFHEEIKYDQTGGSIENVVNMGKKVEVSCKITALTFATMEAIMAGSADGTTNFKSSNLVGRAGRANAKALTITRIVDSVASSDALDVLTIHHAYPIAKLEAQWDDKGDRVLDVVFKCFRSDTSGQVNEYWRAGAA